MYDLFFFNALYFSKYIDVTIIEEHSMRACQMHRIALEKSAIVEMLTYLNLAHLHEANGNYIHATWLLFLLPPLLSSCQVVWIQLFQNAGSLGFCR